MTLSITAQRLTILVHADVVKSLNVIVSDPVAGVVGLARFAYGQDAVGQDSGFRAQTVYSTKYTKEYKGDSIIYRIGFHLMIWQRYTKHSGQAAAVWCNHPNNSINNMATWWTLLGLLSWHPFIPVKSWRSSAHRFLLWIHVSDPAKCGPTPTPRAEA